MAFPYFIQQRLLLVTLSKQHSYTMHCCVIKLKSSNANKIYSCYVDLDKNEGRASNCKDS